MGPKSNKEKVIVNIQYPCYICANEYSGARQVINHVENMHGYILNPRQIGHHRPQSNHYSFENDVKKEWDVQHFGCPSCWFHCPKNFETLMEHIMEEHEPAKVEGFVQKNRDEDEFDDEGVADEYEEVQEIDITSDEEEEAAATERAVRGTSVKKEDPVLEQITAPQTQKGDSSSNKENEDRGTSEEAEGYQKPDVAQDILHKLNDLNDMFKQLFKS
jgi:hypothetical protein